MCKINDNRHQKWINTIPNKYDYPEVSAKFGQCEGENIIFVLT
jgi:hypothetical protein